MTLTRHRPETQRQFVERTLRERGTVGAYDVLYDSRFDDGAPTSITRLASIIHDLRSDGWDIASVDEHGHLAVYRLIASPGQGWQCVTCKGAPAYGVAPHGVLGGYGRGKCTTCGTATFRWAA